MTTEQYLTAAILTLTFAPVIRSKITPVAIFVGARTLTITIRPASLVQHLKGFSNSGMLMERALLMVSPECTAQGPSCWSPTSSSRAGLVKDLINRGQPW